LTHQQLIISFAACEDILLRSQLSITTTTESKMNRFSEIKALFDSLEGDMEKFYDKGNKTAGTRARKTLQDIKKLAQDIRVDIQNKKS
jgi:hypothetical protein